MEDITWPNQVAPRGQKASPTRKIKPQTSNLYDMYLGDEYLETFTASVDVKGAFPNTPHRFIEEVWRQLGLPSCKFVGLYLRNKRYTVATGKG